MDTSEATTPAADGDTRAVQPSGVADEATAHGDTSDIGTEAYDREPEPEDGEPPANPDAAPAADGEGKEGEPKPEGDPDAEEELVEVEYADGKKAKIPKELHRGFLREADYTRKTQALSQKSQALEAEHAARLERVAITESLVEERANVLALEQRAKYFDNIDWQALADEDAENGTNRSVKLWAQRDEAHRAVAEAKAALQTKESERLEAQRQAEDQAAATRRKETGATLAREDGWTKETFGEVIDFGMKTLGYEPEEMADFDARAWRGLRRLQAAEAEVAKLRSDLNKAKTAQQVLGDQVTRPAETPAARAKPVGVKDNLDTKDWMARRNADVARREGR